MWKLFGNIVEMFIYASVYLIIVLISMKVVASTFSPDFEKKIVEEGNLAYAVIGASVCMGMALILMSVIR